MTKEHRLINNGIKTFSLKKGIRDGGCCVQIALCVCVLLREDLIEPREKPQHAPPHFHTLHFTFLSTRLGAYDRGFHHL